AAQQRAGWRHFHRLLLTRQRPCNRQSPGHACRRALRAVQDANETSTRARARVRVVGFYSPAGRRVLCAMPPTAAPGGQRALDAWNKAFTRTRRRTSGASSAYGPSGLTFGAPLGGGGRRSPSVILARALSEPATVRATTHWAKVYSNWVARPHVLDHDQTR